MVLIGDIASALDNMTMSASADQSPVGQLMAKTFQLAETNNILGVQLKQLSEKNQFLARQCKKGIKATNNNDLYLVKMDPTIYCWNVRA